MHLLQEAMQRHADELAGTTEAMRVGNDIGYESAHPTLKGPPAVSKPVDHVNNEHERFVNRLCWAFCAGCVLLYVAGRMVDILTFVSGK